MKEKERKQWKNMNSEEKRNYWIKWDNRDKTGVNLERKKINNIRKTQGVKYIDEITNFIKDFLEIILYQYNEYRDDFKTKTDKAKKNIENTFNKYTSLIIILILLYFLKDFLMWLLVKFDKLLKG
tara:strand:- start:55 stop:429 length:375 start_codon:yes stop_codon:yes gene_type:complete